MCTAGADGNLSGIVERTAISYDKDGNITFVDENGTTQILEPNTPVSMNLWGFTPDYFDYSEREFKNSSTRISTPQERIFSFLSPSTISSRTAKLL